MRSDSQQCVSINFQFFFVFDQLTAAYWSRLTQSNHIGATSAPIINDFRSYSDVGKCSCRLPWQTKVSERWHGGTSPSWLHRISYVGRS